MATRGIRNNNPLNIKYNPKNQWFGQLPLSNADRVFCRFGCRCDGLRAGLVLWLKYARVYHLTLRGALSRFAPASENSLGAYCAYVSSSYYSLKLDQPIKVEFDYFYYLFKALCWYESRYDLSSDIHAFGRLFDFSLKYGNYSLDMYNTFKDFERLDRNSDFCIDTLKK